MKERSVIDQKKIFFNPDDSENVQVPTMPLLVKLDNGVFGEAKTIRGTVAIIIGNEYLDIEDAETEWHVRLQAARREAMKVLSDDKNAVVYDLRMGIIPDNYAAAPGDPDYENNRDEPMQIPIKIRIENDRLFILSLIELGAIKVYERVDSYLLRPHEKWEEEALSKGAVQCCMRCLNAIEKGESLICPVYNAVKEKTDGNKCGSYAIKIQGSDLEYAGGEYIDLEAEYDLYDLQKKVGQEWIIS